LKHVNLSSSRNVFIFGFSLFSGIALKYWAEKPETSISTGSANGDQILSVLLRNGGRNHRREY
jgi:solute carrier family 23 (nucleobase transporter), member 1